MSWCMGRNEYEDIQMEQDKFWKWLISLDKETQGVYSERSNDETKVRVKTVNKEYLTEIIVNTEWIITEKGN